VRNLARVLGAIYLTLVAVSCVVRHTRPSAVRRSGDAQAQVPAIDGDRVLERTIRLAYASAGPDEIPGAPVVVRLHGSPGRKDDFKAVLPELAKHHRVIVPDLPGFGGSEREIPDYSFRAHARYVLELLDTLGIGDVHVVGFSMGGGVALDGRPGAATRALITYTPRSASGDGALGEFNSIMRCTGRARRPLGLRELTPHFVADDAVLGVPYARNFYDPINTARDPPRWPGPMLIVHGRRARAGPGARACATGPAGRSRHPESHFMVFVEGPRSRRCSRLPGAWDQARRRRATAIPSASRRRAGRSTRGPPARGPPWLLVLLFVAVATFVSEDLTCIGAGLLVATGRLGFVPVTAACLTGIVVGDLNAFLAGRVFGRAVLARPPMKWIVTEQQVSRASAWFRARGPAVILASRFLPGTRVATFVAAGVLHTPFLTFAIWFGLAALLWTPLLVGIAALVGAPILGAFHRFQLWAVPAVVLCRGARVAPPRVSFRGFFVARPAPALRDVEAHGAVGVLAAVRLLCAGGAVRSLARHPPSEPDAVHLRQSWRSRRADSSTNRKRRS
jgi:membrane protein DedA with SNARE-associated domain/pimeloyl-ACP methyl ester carboxylesterase